MGRVVAKSVAQVVAGEAVSGTRAQRYADMRAIASVIDNRARALGVTPEQVVSKRSEFNAYGKALPAGAVAYVGLAEKALQDVAVNGPVNNATFYATPAAKNNLPKGLVKEDQTTGHVYFSDPQNRAIGTAVGYRQPDPAALAAARPATNVPTPTFAQRDIGGLLAPAPAQTVALGPLSTTTPAQAAIASAISRPTQSALSPAKEANLASRLGPAPAASPAALSPAQEANLASRLGPAPSAPARQSQVAAPAPTKSTTLNAAQEKNLGERLGVSVNSAPSAMTPTKEANVTGRLNAAEAPASQGISVGGLLGISPAGAATRTPSSPVSSAPASLSAPAPSTGFAGPLGSPRSMEATIAGPQAANRYSPAPSAPAPAAQAAPAATRTAAPAQTNFAGAAGSPRAAQEQSMASLDAASAIGAGMFTGAPAAKPSAPSMSPEDALAADVADQRKSRGLAPLSAPQAVATPPATYSAPIAAPPVQTSAQPAYATAYAPAAPAAPQSIAGVVGQNRQATGLGLPSVPDAPKAGIFDGIGSYLGDNKGKLAGGLLGSAAFGPVGGLLGGLLGAAVQRSMSGPAPSDAAKYAANNLGFDGFGYAGAGSMGLGDFANGIVGYTSGGQAYGMGGSGAAPSAAAQAAARDVGFDGFGYSGASSGSRGGGIGPGGSGARSPNG